MPDPSTPPDGSQTQAPAAQSPEPQAAAPKTLTLTQEQLDGIVQDRLARDRQARAQATQSPAQAPQQNQPAADPEQMTPKQMREAFATLNAQIQFRDLADELGIARELRGDLFDLSQAQRPQDLRAWMTKKAEVYGGKAAQPVSQTPPQDPVKPPAAAPGAPAKVDPVDQNGLVNIFALSEQQIAAMAPAKVREHFDKILEYARSQSGAPPVPRHSLRKG
jgi:hypothetical protein